MRTSVVAGAIVPSFPVILAEAGRKRESTKGLALFLLPQVRLSHPMQAKFECSQDGSCAVQTAVFRTTGDRELLKSMVVGDVLPPLAAGAGRLSAPDVAC